MVVVNEVLQPPV